MNSYNLILISTLLLSACTSDTNEKSNDLISTKLFEQKTKIRFIETEWDFGEIKEGEKVEHLFTFVNEGKSDLIITSAEGSCGCTVPEFPEKPIQAGNSDVIKVVFDSKERAGKQVKSVSVYANTEPILNKLIIKANVITE